MGTKRKIICVSTTSPSTSLTPGGGGGSLVMICPQTGSIRSSLRVAGDMSGKAAVGVLSLSTFPASFSTSNSFLALGFGYTNKKDDSYALLCTLRSGASPPILHWRCRVPEARMSAGMLVSRCGNYIVGGGASGALYIWKSVGGLLLRSVKAHYRSISVMKWSSCGRFLVTGGADGMVHVFSLIGLVEVGNPENTVLPIQTLTKHHLAVTALVPMSSGRVVSGSEDGQVILMELFSGSVLATIHLPHPVTALAESHNRVFVGSKGGIICIVDLDEYALHRTSQLGGTVVRRHIPNSMMSHQQQVFGTSSGEADKNEESPYLTELQGHSRRITSLAVLEYSTQGECLVSGDELGSLRVWDLNARSCVCMLHPWSHSIEQPAKSTTGTAHPVTSISVLEEDMSLEAASDVRFFSAAGRAGGREKNPPSISSLVTPLQKFQQNETSTLSIPFLHSKGSNSLWKVKQMERSIDFQAALSRRRLRQDTYKAAASTKVEKEEEKPNDTEDEVQRLQKDLEVARATIQRWEAVNNKLMGRLQQEHT